jgi:peptide deformylase
MEDLKLITENNPLLKQQCEDWNFKADGDPTELITAMTKIMLNPATQGIGLAAPQCGVMKNIFIMGTDENLIAVINPKIDELIGDKEIYLEGCLSFPNLWLHVKRNPEALVSYQVSTGEWVNKQKLEGLKARVFLHEYDHLLGVTFDERCGELSLSLAKKRRAKAVRLKQKLANKIASQALSSSS